MQKLHAHIANDRVFVFQNQTTGVLKTPDRRRHHRLRRTKIPERLPLVFGHRKHHPLLRLRNPDLGIRKPVVLQRHLVQPNLRTGLLAHLADRTRIPTGTAVSHRVVQIKIASLQQHVHGHFFSHRVTDLNRTTGRDVAIFGKLRTAERRPVDPIATGLAADRNDQVARFDFFERLVVRQNANVATEHQRIANVTIVKVNRTVDRRDPHAVSIITNPRNNALHDLLGMHHARRKILVRRVGRSKTKHVRITNRLSPQARPQRIANHPADTRVGSTVRLQGRRAVMGFDFESHVMVAFEANDAGVVLEHAHAPIVFAQVLTDLHRGCKDGFLQHVFVLASPIFIGVGNSAGKRLVATVFGPRLSNRFQLDIRWGSSNRFEVVADNMHLRQRKAQRPILADLH